MKKYEIACIFKRDADSALLKEKVNAILKGIQAEIVTNDDWGMRRLSYPIKKETEGYYYFIKFAADPLKIVEVKKELFHIETIIKYMILVDEHQHIFRKDEPVPVKAAAPAPAPAVQPAP